MNKYLEKVAASFTSRAVSRVGDFAEKVVGHNARTLKRDAEALGRHAVLGNTPKRVKEMADVAGKETRDARIKLGLGSVAAIGGGFLGAHKYHQHKDRVIMQRIDNMYRDPNGAKK